MRTRQSVTRFGAVPCALHSRGCFPLCCTFGVCRFARFFGRAEQAFPGLSSGLSSSKEKTVEVFGALVGAEISLQSWSLACIPVRLGGLGLQDPQRIHPAARISSFVSASAAALQYTLPQAEVSHSDLLAVFPRACVPAALPAPPQRRQRWAAAPRRHRQP